jgi:hypothetical protein
MNELELVMNELELGSGSLELGTGSLELGSFTPLPKWKVPAGGVAELESEHCMCY